MRLFRATVLFLALSVFSRGADQFAEADRKQCRRQLLLLRDALEHYREQHGDWPGSLAELLPEYIADRSLFDCPHALRTGIRSKEDLSRPQSSVGSYSYEFPLEPLRVAGIKRMRREWKERQMSLVGDAVPLLRCLSHEQDRVLNLPVRGPIYESGLYWEKNFTNQTLPLPDFEDEALFAREISVRAGLAPRNAKATPAQINLEGYYNLRLDDPLIARLVPAAGFRSSANLQFDLRGAIQLRFSGTSGQQFPKNVLAIPINAKCQRLYFLHGISEPLKPGTIVAWYGMRDLFGRVHAMPIAYGRDVVAAESGVEAEASSGLAQPQVIEIIGDSKRPPVRLCISSWTNPSPDVAIASIDLRSEVTPTAPFVLAITAE